MSDVSIGTTTPTAMSTEIHCPQCSSANVFFSKKRGVNVCEDCGFEIATEKPFIPLRIFLSYGHDSNEELVRRIKADLEQRGHDAWFDKSEGEPKGTRLALRSIASEASFR